MMRAGNPVMNAFERPMDYASLAGTRERPRAMTLQGTINASAVLLGLAACSALATAMLVPEALLWPAVMVGSIAGLVVALVISFNPRSAPIAGPFYALIEGVALGAISLLYETQIDAQSASAAAAGEGTNWAQAIGGSIVFQAVLLTFGIAGAMLLAYSLRVIRVTPMFFKVVVMLTLGYVFASLGTFVLHLFGVGIPYLHEMGGLGIAIAGGVVVLAAVNLLLDFHIIEKGVETGQPKYMEWYGAFALTVTLVWLYLRVLYLLALLRRND
jgi:uncharacterized YccA/Bax inhibitor family protein